MKCEDCGIETSVATLSPDSTGLMRCRCTDCTAKTSVAYPKRIIAEIEAKIAALEMQWDAIQRDSNVTLERCRALPGALVEAREIAVAQGSFHPDEADRIAELRKLAEEQ